MALREIRKNGDEILKKKSRDVAEIDERVKALVQDMFDTMYNANGVGLAAVQVGVLKKIVVVDIGEGPIVLINPEIINSEGEVIDVEGCLSVPGTYGEVARPKRVKVKAKDIDGKEIILEGEDFLARAFCHEVDHLHGNVFIEKVIRFTEGG